MHSQTLILAKLVIVDGNLRAPSFIYGNSLLLESDLLHSYCQTLYRVKSSPAIEVRIGQANTQLDRLLDSYQTSCWAIITAYNPASKILPEAENIARQAALVKQCSQYPQLVTEHIAEPADSWPIERGVCLMGITKEAALELAVEFEQNAIVFGRQGASAELLWCQRLSH